MIWSLLPAFAVTPMVPETSVLLAVFPEVPSDKARNKVVRRAFKEADTLRDGRDWGRVLCFRFDGPGDPGALERAVAKVGLTAEIKAGPTCEEPPVEAFADREPAAWVRVVVPDALPVEPVQSVLAALLRLDLGVLAVKSSPVVAGRLCLELAAAPDLEKLTLAVDALGVETLALEPATSCVDALTSGLPAPAPAPALTPAPAPEGPPADPP